MSHRATVLTVVSELLISLFPHLQSEADPAVQLWDGLHLLDDPVDIIRYTVKLNRVLPVESDEA